MIDLVNVGIERHSLQVSFDNDAPDVFRNDSASAWRPHEQESGGNCKHEAERDGFELRVPHLDEDEDPGKITCQRDGYSTKFVFYPALLATSDLNQVVRFRPCYQQTDYPEPSGNFMHSVPVFANPVTESMLALDSPGLPNRSGDGLLGPHRDLGNFGSCASVTMGTMVRGPQTSSVRYQREPFAL